MIPISKVVLPTEAEKLAVEVIRSGRLASGPLVERFENEFAALVGVEHAVAVNNGTTALVAALQVLDLEPGDEVVTSPFTFVATLNAILEAGATARFADISEDDFCLDPAAVSAVIGPKSKVLLPVHLYGQAANMTKLAQLAARAGLSMVEDTAQAHGATIEGRGAGSFGLGTFSFYGTKNLTTGEGGMITTSDDRLAAKLRVLRNQGMVQRYQYELAGHNYRLTDLQAALALPQLAVYSEQVKRRRDNAARLTEGLAGIPGLRTPAEMPGRYHVWHQYTIVLSPEAALTRDELSARLAELGVASGVYYPRLVHDYDCFRNHPRVVVEATPVAQRIANGCLSLPVHQHLSSADVDAVIFAVRKALGA